MMSLGHLIVLENKETCKKIKIIKLRVYIKGTPKLIEGAPKGQSWKNWGKKRFNPKHKINIQGSIIQI